MSLRDLKLENVLLKLHAVTGEVLRADVADLNAVILAPGETSGKALWVGVLRGAGYGCMEVCARTPARRVNREV